MSTGNLKKGKVMVKKIIYRESKVGCPRKQYSIRLDEKIMKDFKKMAKKNGVTASIYVENAIAEKLTREQTT